MDIPISSVIIALFITAAAANMTIFLRNKKRMHKFILSGVTFGFCMTRIVANVMRIVWAEYPSNSRVVIAALIFANAGVILLFVINLIFTQRLLRAYHPKFGWSRPITYIFRFFYASIGLSLVMLIIAVVYIFYTLDAGIRGQLRDVQLTAITYLAILAFLPVPITVVSILVPHSGPLDKFGQGRMRSKVRLLLFTSTLLAFGASFRAAVLYMPRPATNPAWFHHKALYYCLNYVIELIVVATYTLARTDKRFHIPNGSSAPGHYMQGVPGAGERGVGDKLSADMSHNTDEEIFGGTRRPATVQEQRVQEAAWEARAQREMEMNEVV